MCLSLRSFRHPSENFQQQLAEGNYTDGKKKSTSLSARPCTKVTARCTPQIRTCMHGPSAVRITQNRKQSQHRPLRPAGWLLRSCPSARLGSFSNPHPMMITLVLFSVIIMSSFFPLPLFFCGQLTAQVLQLAPSAALSLPCVSACSSRVSSGRSPVQSNLPP